MIGDWQGIGQDPCSSANIIDHFNASTNSSRLEYNDYSQLQSGMFSTDSVLNSGGDSTANREDYLLSPAPLPDEMKSSNSSLHSQWVESCEALSSSSHQCFWNPKSRITGEFCNTCDTACYSEQQSFNFYQFSAGVMLICLSSPPAFVFISSITSAYTPVDHQVSFLCITVKEWNIYIKLYQVIFHTCMHTVLRCFIQFSRFIIRLLEYSPSCKLIKTSLMYCIIKILIQIRP